jgi:hypothetical protein
VSLMGFSCWQLGLGALTATLAICGNILAVVMVGKVNERVPEPDRISYLWWNANIAVKYRQLYPSGKLASYYRACVAGMFLCMGAVIVSITLGH